MVGVVTFVLLSPVPTSPASCSLAVHRGSAKSPSELPWGRDPRGWCEQLLTESILLAFAGGAAGLFLVAWGTRLLVAVLARNFHIPRLADTHIDIWVLAFTFGVSAAAGILFGILPALGTGSVHAHDGLRQSSRATGGRRGQRIRAALVIMETALALILLSGAALLLKGFLVMRSTAPGFQTDHLLAVDFSLPRIKFAATAERFNYFENVLDRTDGIAGVRSSALVADLPLAGGEDGLGFHIAGRPDPAPGRSFQANVNIASAGYFRTMGIPLRAGRELPQTVPG